MSDENFNGNSGNDSNRDYNFWRDQASGEERRETDMNQTGDNQDSSEAPSVNFTMPYYEAESEEKTRQDTVAPENIPAEKSSYAKDYTKLDRQEYHSTAAETAAYSATEPESADGKKKNKKVKTKKNGGFVKNLFKLAAAALVFGLVAGGAFYGINYAIGSLNGSSNKEALVNISGSEDGKKVEKTTILQSTPVNNSAELKNDVVTVVENTMPSIVSITSTITQSMNIWGQTYNQDATGSGSGIIIGESDDELLIVTNNHVVNGATKIAVTFIDDETVQAIVKGTDTAADLAVISIKLSDMKKDTISEIKVASIGDSEDLKVGEKAVAIGNALGYGQSVTVGYISAKNRTVKVDDRTMKLLQTDAAINPGNSGGALLNINGQVVGINSVKYSDTDVEGIGYAIPISEALPIINDLMSRETVSDEEKGYLGISCEDITEEDNKYNMPTGVYVTDVAKKGAAKEAGMIKGDIITKINGMEVTSRTALQERVGSYRIGTEVTVTIKRYQDGEYIEKELKVTLKGLDSLNDLTREEQEQQGGGREQQPQVPDQDQSPYSQYPSDDYGSFFDFFNNFMR